MAKNKRHKYERVKHLPNVTFSVFGESRPFLSYPWHAARYNGMKKILELGCGKGEHSLAFAAANPHRLCIGIDYKSHRMCVGAEKAIAQGLENVHFLCTRIEHIREFFLKQSIHEIWLTFPDPHPKNREIKFRLSASPFLDAYAHLLIPGGTVNLKTDSDLFCTYTRESLATWGGHLVRMPDTVHGPDHTNAHDIVSDYERAALAKGMTIKHMTFTLS